jgi:transposase
VGPILTAVFVAEIGDVTRSPTPAHLASWAGMTPKHRESDTKVHRGKISKQGSRHVRWAAVEAVSKNHGGDTIKAHYRRIAERRGRNIGRVAAARKVLTLVFYGLRDGEIRCLR